MACTDLRAGYSGNAVVRELSFELDAAEVLALLGPNGAGKTTTLLTLSGLIPALGGSIRHRGITITRLPPAKISRRGVVLVPDDRALFTTLTVADNLSLARRRGGPSIAEVIGYFPQLEDKRQRVAGLLSGGEQQMLAIGRALMQRPDVLMIDELSLGLAPILVQRILAALRQIVDETGTPVILVEQHVRLALGAADRALVLVHGQVALSAPAAELLAEPDLLERAYLSGADLPARPGTR